MVEVVVIRTYLIAGLAVALSAAVTVAVWQSSRVGALQDDNEALTALLRAERAKVELLRKERESDAAIDAIPDSDLRGIVPDRWLLRDNPPR